MVEKLQRFRLDNSITRQLDHPVIMSDSHRSWFPLILTGLSLGLAALIFAVYEPREVASSQQPVVSQAPTAEQYQAAVNAVFSTYEANGDTQAAYDALVAIRVPVEFLDVHLALVYALNDLQAGQSAEGQARLDAIRAVNSWLK